MASAEIGAALNQLIHEMSSSLSGHLIPALDEMKQKFDQEDQRVVDWSHDIRSALDETQAHWKEFTANAMQELQGVESTIDATLPDVESNAHQYEEKLAEVTNELHTASATYSEHSSQLVEQMGSLAEHHVQLEHDVDHHVNDWTDNIHTMVGHIDEHHSQIADAYALVTQKVTHGSDEIVTHIGQASGDVNEHVASLVTQNAGLVADLLGHSKDHMVNHVGGALGGAMGESMSALEGFMHAGEELGHAFDGGLGDMLGVVEHVGDVVKAIEPVIKLAEELL